MKKSKLYKLVKEAVTDDVMGLCHNDACAEVLGRVCPKAFGWEPFVENADRQERYWDRINLVDSMMIDIMLDRGYELEDGEVMDRDISCFTETDGVYVLTFHDKVMAIVAPCCDAYVAGLFDDNGLMKSIGCGDTPQGALDDMRMIGVNWDHEEA